MASNTETGNAKNVSNYSLLVAYIKEMGTDYNPANPDIKLTALTAKETACINAMKDVTDTLVPSKNAINARDNEYKVMSKTATRVINSLAGSGVTSDILKDARGIVNKVTGKRTGTKPEGDPTNPEGKTISVSQMSFDSRKANFELLVALVKGQPKYNPNETDLKVTALESYVAGLGGVNTTVNNSLTALNAKRNLRDKVLYEPIFGMSELVGTVKSYVKSVVGVSSPVYKRIAAIQIRKPKVL